MATLHGKSLIETSKRTIKSEYLNGGFTVEKYRHQATVEFTVERSRIVSGALDSEARRALHAAFAALVARHPQTKWGNPSDCLVVACEMALGDADTLKGKLLGEFTTGASYYDGD